MSFRDYEIYLLFLLLVKFHGSGKCEIYSAVQRILQCFLPCAILSLETKNADPLFLNVMFVKMISKPQGGFPQFLYFKFKIWCWDFISSECNDLDVKLVFSSFKIDNLFGVKDPVPDGLRSHVVYKFVCAGCNACYIGETCQHFSTHVREHLVSDRASHIFKHLKDSAHCRALCSADNFHVLDHTPTGFQLKIKEAIYIQREQPCIL